MADGHQMARSGCEPRHKRRRQRRANKLCLSGATETHVMTEGGTSVDFCLVSLPMKVLWGSQSAQNWAVHCSGRTARPQTKQAMFALTICIWKLGWFFFHLFSFFLTSSSSTSCRSGIASVFPVSLTTPLLHLLGPSRLWFSTLYVWSWARPPLTSGGFALSIASDLMQQGNHQISFPGAGSHQIPFPSLIVSISLPYTNTQPIRWSGFHI